MSQCARGRGDEILRASRPVGTELSLARVRAVYNNIMLSTPGRRCAHLSPARTMVGMGGAERRSGMIGRGDTQSTRGPSLVPTEVERAHCDAQNRSTLNHMFFVKGLSRLISTTAL